MSQMSADEAFCCTLRSKVSSSKSFKYSIVYDLGVRRNTGKAVRCNTQHFIIFPPLLSLCDLVARCKKRINIYKDNNPLYTLVARCRERAHKGLKPQIVMMAMIKSCENS